MHVLQAQMADATTFSDETEEAQPSHRRSPDGQAIDRVAIPVEAAGKGGSLKAIRDIRIGGNHGFGEDFAVGEVGV
jgi:hypothetical protein